MKRVLCLVLVCLLVPLYGFAEGVPSSTQTLPISEEPITLEAWVLDVNNTGNLADSPLWDWLAEKTNVRFEVTAFSMSQQEALQLMFATLDLNELPDVAFRLDMPANLLSDAAEGEFLVELSDELLEQYAPYWANFLKENPAADTQRYAGKRIGLPNCDYVEYTGNLRDLLAINKVWLDELGLEIPTTISEFTNVLQAFKDNAGKGSIPQEVIPFYYQWDHRISGMFDVLGFWGITVTQTNWLAIEDGKVVFQGVNPAIKEPIKYLAELYAKGLTPPESFTDDRNMSIARTSSETPYLGFFSIFNNPNPDVYVPIAPIDTETGVKPRIRKQEFSTTGINDFIIFADNPYIEECLRVIDWIASTPEATANFQRGMQGYYWDYDENGMITPMDPNKLSDEDQKLYAGLGNFIAGIRADDFYSYYNDLDYQDPTTRAWAYENIYKAYVPEGETNYRNVSTGDEDLDQRRSDLAVAIDNLRSTTLARWITGQGDIDAEWDAYVEQMNSLGLEEYLSLCQMSYDTIGLND